MAVEAWLFWSALLCLLPLGAAFALQPKKDARHKAGLVLMPASLIIAISAAALLHTNGAITPEVELAAVLIHLLPVGGLLGIGALIAVFGGPTPVGEIPPVWRIAGLVAMASGIIILWFLSTTYAPSVALDTGLLTSWPRVAMAALLTITVVGWLGFGFTIIMGSERYYAAGALATIGLIGLAIIQRAMQVEALRLGMVGAIDDLAGITLGLISATVVVGALIVQTERRMTPMEVVPDLTEDERARAIEILATAVADDGGEEE
jgi:hypothetical protein